MSAILPDKPRTTPEVVTLEELPLAVVRHPAITITELPTAFDTGFTALMQVLAGREDVLVHAVGIFHGDPAATFALKVAAVLGRPLGQPVRVGEVLIEPDVMPAGRYASLSHVGPYGALPSTWQRLMSELPSRGTGTWFESYVSDPSSTPEDDLRTDLFVAL